MISSCRRSKLFYLIDEYLLYIIILSYTLKLSGAWEGHYYVFLLPPHHLFMLASFWGFHLQNSSFVSYPMHQVFLRAPPLPLKRNIPQRSQFQTSAYLNKSATMAATQNFPTIQKKRWGDLTSKQSIINKIRTKIRKDYNSIHI